MRHLLSILFLTTFCSINGQNLTPLEFIPNEGQWRAPFQYKAQSGGSEIFLSHDRVTFTVAHQDNLELYHQIHHPHDDKPFTLKWHSYAMKFVNALTPEINARKKQPHYYNYFLGNEPQYWKNNIHPVLNVDYKNIYPNTDVHFYSEYGNLKYDWILHRGADIKNIKLMYEGVDGISISKKGSLVLKTSVGEILELRPYTYQYINGEKKEIKAQYQIQDNYVSFKVGDYNTDLDLIIDPVVVFCSLTGSTADNWGFTATYDDAGNFYAGGITGFGVPGTFQGNFPTTLGAFDATFNGGGPGGMGNVYRYDATITKFNANGTSLIYSTYLGGSDNDHPQSIIVNKKNQLVVVGRTYSSNFPTFNAADATHNDSADLFITIFDSTGNNLVGSTYIGGSGEDGTNISPDPNTISGLKHNFGDDARSEVIVDEQDGIWVSACTRSTNFPMRNPIQATKSGGQDAVIFKVSRDGDSILWSSYLGGSGDDAGYVLSFNKQNQSQLFVAGGTASSNFPVTATNILKPTYGGAIDGWLAKLNVVNYNTVTTNKITFVGTSAYDQIYGVQTDDSGYVYIMGQSQGAYPVVGPNVYSNPNSSQFASKISNDLQSYVRSTVFGKGSTFETDISPNAFLVDKCGNIYISGWGGPIVSGHPGNTSNLPVTSNAVKSVSDGSDFYFIVFRKNFDSLLFASFYGQNGGGGEHVDGGTSRFDPQGRIYQSICASCGANTIPGFPTTPGVWGPNDPSPNCNLAALKIDFQLIGANADAQIANSGIGCAPLTINFINLSSNATSYLWNFGDGSATTTVNTPTHTYTSPGTYTATLVAFNPNGCFGTSDTDQVIITVLDDTIKNSFLTAKIDSCNPYTLQVTNQSTFYGNNFSSATQWLWNFGDGTTSTLQNPPIKSYNNPGTYAVSLTIIDPNACNSPVTVTKSVSYTNNLVDANFTVPPINCAPHTQSFINSATGNATGYLWLFGDGNQSTLATPSHTYNNPGTYTVTLIAYNPNTCNLSDTAKQVIKILPDITASFNFTKTDTCNPYIISIQNTSKQNSLTPSNTINTWNFGDGTSFVGANPPPHSYPSTGTYTITLTLTDTTACNSPQVITKTVTFIDNYVKANVQVPDSVCIPYTHSFNNNSYNATTYLWSFGDGTTSTLSAPTHTYNTPGTYKIKLITLNPLSCNKADSVIKNIYVSDIPTANFSFLPNPPQPNKAIQFTNLSVGADRYLWDFGDGTSSTEINPKKLYNKGGQVSVCLTAFNKTGCSDTACQILTPEVINTVDIPTGFTPNGDGINDYVTIRGFGIESLEFRIYNRWGENVFTSNKLDIPWDGKYKGVLQEADAYAYFASVRFTDGTNRILKGNITLIR